MSALLRPPQRMVSRSLWVAPGGRAAERKAAVAAALPRIVFRGGGSGGGGSGGGDNACFSRRRRGAVAVASTSSTSSSSASASPEQQDTPTAAAPSSTSTSSWPPPDPSLLPLGPAAPFLLSRPSPEEIVAVNFYHLADLPSARATRKRHEAFLAGKDVRGRIYIAPQGINAQFSAPAGVAAEYLIWVKNESESVSSEVEKGEEGEEGEGNVFPSKSSSSSAAAQAAAARSLLETMRANSEPSPRGEHLFPKLRLKYKPNLISLAGGTASLPITDPGARAAPLSPRQWEAMLLEGGGGGNEEKKRHRPIVLDVRNAYEWDAGHFEGAERPLEDNFCETPTDATRAASEGDDADSADDDDEDADSSSSSSSSSSTQLDVPALLASAPRDAPVMMYCTGGIRCDIYSAHLRRKGFTNLYTLEGGVHNYFNEVGGRGWEGSLFVFDARMAVAPAKGEGGGGEEDSGGDDAAAASADAASAAKPPLPAAAPCLLCGGRASLPHLNCSNIDCNRLFIACSGCALRLSGCCCEACVAAPRLLRPAKVSGYYGTWASEAEAVIAAVGQGDQAAAASSLAAARAAMSSGRGSGRLARRRARAERLSQERAAAKEERLRKKAAAKAELAKRGGGEGGAMGESEEGCDEERAARLAKLEALRSKLLVRR